MQLDTWVNAAGKEPSSDEEVITTLFYRKLRKNPAYRNKVLAGLVRARGNALRRSFDLFNTSPYPWARGWMPTGAPANKWDAAAALLDAEIVFVVECSFATYAGES